MTQDYGYDSGASKAGGDFCVLYCCLQWAKEREALDFVLFFVFVVVDDVIILIVAIVAVVIVVAVVVGVVSGGPVWVAIAGHRM